MAQQYTGYLAATTLTKVFEPTGAADKTIESLTLTNTNSSAETVDLVIVRADATANDLLLPVDKSIAAGTMCGGFADGKILRDGDAIWGNATTSSKVLLSVQVGKVVR
jgi:hypothetical protein